jgi:hypothetical protein
MKVASPKTLQFYSNSECLLKISADGSIDVKYPDRLNETAEMFVKYVNELVTDRMHPTHQHKKGGLYKVTCEERLEVTGDDAILMVDYEDMTGKKFCQVYDRFHDGRFRRIVGSKLPFGGES